MYATSNHYNIVVFSLWPTMGSIFRIEARRAAKVFLVPPRWGEPFTQESASVYLAETRRPPADETIVLA